MTDPILKLIAGMGEPVSCRGLEINYERRFVNVIYRIQVMLGNDVAYVAWRNSYGDSSQGIITMSSPYVLPPPVISNALVHMTDDEFVRWLNKIEYDT